MVESVIDYTTAMAHTSLVRSHAIPEQVNAGASTGSMHVHMRSRYETLPL